MTTLLEIKPYIHDFIEENLDTAFSGKVYYIGEREEVPEYPYCLLNIIAESKDQDLVDYTKETKELFLQQQ